ncbi:unnamed protein product [Lactuca virosa]|uniref:Bulb-type lectin domain-containing protein n=1 Tax=Lactuca virosa TaxID=75947 RepID=A0AAU9P6I5_9ASTR|nr:unnamed protein product [Lactuca virosa]
MMREIFLLFLLFCSLIESSASKNTIKDHLQRDSSLSVDDSSDVIRSPDNTYTCGFYGFQSNAYWFAIWFTDSKERTVVWTANRNTPVNGRGSKLTFRKNGAMVLTDVDGMVVWETNTTSTDVNRAVLLNTGNLVLKNQKGQIRWQSFDYPTDTLLPSQTLTKRKSLISALRKGSFEPGYFVLSYNSINVLILTYDSPETTVLYWPSPDPGFNVWSYGRTSYNSSRIAVFDDFGVFRSSDRWQFNASDMGFGIKRRLTMDYDGNLRIYSLNDSTGLWSISWQAIAQPCNVLGICGRNGICDNGVLQSECSCPPNHQQTNPTDVSQGCKPTFNTTCSNSTKFGFLEMPNTDYYGFDLNSIDAFLPTSFDACKDMCLRNCRCIAFSYRLTGEGFCFIKNALFNGFRSPNFPGSIYLKVPIDMETRESVSVLTGSNATCVEVVTVMVGSPSMYEPSETKVKWVYLYSFAIAIGVAEAFVILLGWWLFYRKNALLTSLEEGYRMEGEEEETELMRFVRVAKTKLQGEEMESWIEEIIDLRLGGLFSRKQAAKLVEIGVSCVEEDRNKRPTVDSVVHDLIDCESE